MPIYEYACKACHFEFELLVREQEKPSCPDCQGYELEKLLSVPAAHAKNGSDLSICNNPATPTCGAPMCQTGCQFES